MSYPVPAFHEIFGIESTLPIQLALFIIFSIILIKAASLAVKHVINLARIFHISEFVTAFLIAGFVSILPEFFVGINSAIGGVPHVGIGTLIGNNIVDLTLVVGIVAILGKAIPAQRTNKVSSPGFLVALALPLGLMLDGNLSRLDGFLLIMSAAVYFTWMLYNQPFHEKNKKNVNGKEIIPDLVQFIIMVALMFVSSHFVVTSGVAVADLIGFPEILAGLILISIGAALPELTFSIQALMARHKSVAMGDILGNVVLDSTFSIGAMALLVPFDIQLGVIGIAAVFMVFAALMVTTFFDSERQLTRRDGIALIGLYIVFVVVQLTLNTALNPVEIIPHP
jgi:cation:H+ antiporter